MNSECALKNIRFLCVGEPITCRCCGKDVCRSHRREVLFLIACVCYRCIAFDKEYIFLGSTEYARRGVNRHMIKELEELYCHSGILTKSARKI